MSSRRLCKKEKGGSHGAALRRTINCTTGSLPQPAPSATGYFRAYQSTTLGCCFTASTNRSNLRKAPNTSVGM